MKTEECDLIGGLVDDLEPVRAFNRKIGWLALLAAALGTAGATIAWAGLGAQATPTYLLSTGILTMLGVACGAAAIAMASPRVGSHHVGARWAIAMTALLPLTALVLIARQGPQGAAFTSSDWHCLEHGTLFSLLGAAVLTMWLRRGAPVAPKVAGLMAGIAAGALGTVVWGLTCRLDGPVHLGIWHVLPVAVWAVIGWTVIGRAIRW